VNVVSDARLPAQLGSRPFDGEGVATRRNQLVAKGAFQSFLFDSYYARRLGRRTTGSAARTGDAITIGGGNLVFEAGETPVEDIIASVNDGLYLTTTMGFGINLTTGDFSRGAAGIWIENGELTYPVTEINVSGNLKDMLRDIEAVGSDQIWLAGTAAPTIKMSRLTVSGL
jgi:PmbA protein